MYSTYSLRRQYLQDDTTCVYITRGGMRVFEPRAVVVLIVSCWHRTPVFSVFARFSPDDSFCPTQNSSSVVLWDASSGQCLSRCRSQPFDVHAAWMPDGQHFVAGLDVKYDDTWVCCCHYTLKNARMCHTIKKISIFHHVPYHSGRKCKHYS